MLIIATTSFAACSDMDGLPFAVYFVNWTDQAVTIIDVGGSGEDELVKAVKPRSPASLLITDKQLSRCSGGNYVARDPSGKEIARHPDNHCHNWAVTLGPVGYTITNPSSRAVDILYQGRSTVMVAAEVAPGASITGTVDTLGDPSDLCTGGLLGARPASQQLVSPSMVFQYDRSIPKKNVSSCADWTWAVACDIAMPTGAPRPSTWPTDQPWPICS